MLKKAQKLTKTYINSQEPSKTMSKTRILAVPNEKTNPIASLCLEARSTKSEIRNKAIAQQNINMQNKPNLRVSPPGTPSPQRFY